VVVVVPRQDGHGVGTVWLLLPRVSTWRRFGVRATHRTLPLPCSAARPAPGCRPHILFLPGRTNIMMGMRQEAAAGAGMKRQVAGVCLRSMRPLWRQWLCRASYGWASALSGCCPGAFSILILLVIW
jgi:hypothetical protein